jgi:hypothetical protein
MAKTGSKNRIPEQAGSSTPAKKTGRPRKPLPDYGIFNHTFGRSEDFAAFLSGYPPSTGLMAYVYRLRPRIDFGLIGRDETNILETPHIDQMTAGYIASQFGRGKYQLRLTDSNRPQHQRQICKTWFLLEDEEKAPVYDIRTLVLSAQDNTDEVNRQIQLGALVRDQNGTPRLRTASDGPGGGVIYMNGSQPPQNGTSDMDGLIKTAFATLLTRMTETPGERFSNTIEMAKLLQPAQPAGVDQIAERVAEKLGVTGAGKSDPFLVWERVEGFVSKVRGDGNGAAAANGGGGGIIRDIAALMAAATQFLPTAVNTFEYVRQQRGRIQISVAPPHVPPGAAAPGMPFQPAAAAAAPQMPVTAQQPQGQEQLAPLHERIATVAMIGYGEMIRGIRGLDFASWVCNYYPGGREVFAFLDPNGTDGFLRLMQGNPAAAPVLADAGQLSQLRAFLDEFFSYDGGPDNGVSSSGGGVDGPPSPGAAAVVG